jgi:SacI homology domain
VQVRGSIPFFWQQKGKGLKPRPVVDISSSAVCNTKQRERGKREEKREKVIRSSTCYPRNRGYYNKYTFSILLFFILFV